MTQDIYSAFEEHDFFGEFFHSEKSYEARFVGKVFYSPEKGLILQYNITDSGVPSECDSLFGILDNGKKCTLIGPFNFNDGGHRWGAMHTKYGKHGFSHLILGDFIDPEKAFDHCRFTFHHMQEFFYPQGHLSNIPYKDGVLERIDGKGWRITLENRAQFNNVTRNLTNLIFTDDKAVLNEFSTAFEKVKEHHPNEFFLLRKSLEFLFKYESDSTQTVSEINLEINKISALFSIFMNKPTFPDEVKLFPTKKPKDSVSLLSSICLDSRTVALAKSKPSHFFMPINKSKVDIAQAITSWFELYDTFRVLSTTFQYETNFRTLHSAYSDIVLFVTNIEAVAKDLTMDSNNKYEGPINHYGSGKLINGLKKIFLEHNNDDLGTNISNLRNELTHVGRPIKLIKLLNIQDYIYVGLLLKLVVVSHLLEKIGVNFRVIHEYQDKLIPNDSN